MSDELHKMAADAARWRANPAGAGPLRATRDEMHADPMGSLPLKYVVLVWTPSDDLADLYAAKVAAGRTYTTARGARLHVCLEDFRMVGREAGLRVFHSNSARAPQLVQALLLDTALACGVTATPLKTFAH